MPSRVLEIEMHKAEPDIALNWADYIDNLQSIDLVSWSNRRRRSPLPPAKPTSRRPEPAFGNADAETSRIDQQRQETNER